MAHIISSSIRVSGSIYANSFSGSGVEVIGVVSSSYAATSSITISSSYALTASYALNGGSGGGGATVIISGSVPTTPVPSGSLWWNEADGNLYIQTQAPTGSIYAPATAYASAQISSSYAATASIAQTTISASYAATASIVTSASYALTSSYSSYATTALTASYAISASHEIIKEVSSSYADTASIATSASYALTSSYSSFALTASYAISASHEIVKEVSSSYADTASIATSSSYALTASYALNGGSGGGGNTSVIVSGSVPSGSQASGSLWWNKQNGNLYIQVAEPTGSNWVPAVSSVAGGEFGATVRENYAGDSWVVNHNLGTTSPIIQIYSGSNQIIPADIQINNSNTLTVSLAEAISGSVVVSTGVGGPTSASYAVASTSATSASYAVTATSASHAIISDTTSQINDQTASSYIDVGSMRFLTGISSISGASATVTFNHAFGSAPVVVANIKGFSGDSARSLRIETITATTFDCTVFFSTSGVATNGTITWQAMGLKP